jgi:LacI family transcriptional regulator
MAVKMKDIADELGVSLVTISKALRDHPDISKQMRQRVLERVKALNYRPNLAARALVTGRSSLVGLIVPDLINPFFVEVAKSLSLALRQHGYFLLITSSEEDAELERQEIEAMLAHRLDAIVVASFALNSDALRVAQSGDTPLILIDRSFEEFSAHFVGSDDYAIGKLAGEHLLSIGCKRLAHIRGPENNVGIRRLKGFTDTLKRHGFELPPEFIFNARSVNVDGKRHGSDAVKYFMRLKNPPDGVFCYNDVIAIGLIMEAKHQHISIPQDLAVIGCGNLHFDDAIRVPLSSIDQRTAGIGRRTAKLILELAASKEVVQLIRKIVVQPQLVPRESTERVKRPARSRAKSEPRT